MSEDRVLDISWGTIFKAAVTLLAFYIIYLIKDILIWVIFALIISILFDPVVDFLQRRRMPRTIAVIFVYVAIFGILGLFIYWTAPVFTLALQEWLVRVSVSIFGAIISIFGGIISTLTIFSIAIFLSIEERGVERAIALLVPRKQEDYFLNLWQRCQFKTAAWFGTRILSSLFVGLVSYLALRLLNINYAFVLSLFAGVLEIVPVLGPLFAGIIITMLAALDSWFKAFLILIIFILIQQIEGNVLTPVLTQRLIGLPAVLVLISLLIGGKLLGVLGAILAIPLGGIIYEFLKDFLEKRKEEGKVLA